MGRFQTPALFAAIVLVSGVPDAGGDDTPAKYLTSVWSPATPVEAAADAGPARQDLATTIENAHVRLRFKPAEKGFSLGSMVFLKNGREALSRVDDRPKWWQVDVRTADRRVVTMSNTDAPPGRFVPFEDKATGGQFVWDNVKVPSATGALAVTVTVRLVPGSPLARFRIAVDNRLEKASLWDVHFPYVNHLGCPGQSDVMVPSTHSMMVHGELHRGATGRMYASYLGAPYVDYPGGGFPIGHLSASIGDNTVVYVGCHDPKGSTKGYGWNMDEGLRFHVPPPNMSQPVVGYEQDWDYVIGPIEGDWFDAARLYREWATKQFWCAKGRLWDRKVQPRTFFEVPWWGDPQWPGAGYRDQAFPDDARASTVDKQFQPPAGQFDPNARDYDVQRDEMLRRNELAVKTYGLPLGIQWYGWHKARFDGNYPQYFPARPGFPDALRAHARPDLYVHGFLNGLWFDRSLPEFQEAAPWAILDAAAFNQKAQGPLDPLKEREGTALICPYTPFWQRRMAELAAQMADAGFTWTCWRTPEVSSALILPTDIRRGAETGTSRVRGR